MSQSISMILIGGLIRLLQGFTAVAPTLLVGIFLAAVLRYYLGKEHTRRLFGGDSWRSLPQSWFLGMLIPVCSIGVLPMLREMRRAGVKPGAMSAFALSAPLFNPLSLLYGLTLSRPLVIVLFAIGSLFIVTVLGFLWDLIDKKSATGGNDEQPENIAASSDHDDDEIKSSNQLIGMRRIIATLVYFARDITGSSLALTMLGLSGLALVAATLPYGAMQNAVERDDWWAPLRMLFVAGPFYATPMMAMSQLGMMFQHANSPGASFTLLILGTGMNLATPVWFAKHYGIKATAAWLISLLVVVLAISYAVNRPLIPPGIEPAGHTHAFDIYANPLSEAHVISGFTLKEMMTKDLDIGEIVSLSVMALVVVLGLVLRAVRVDEAWLIKTAKPNSLASSLHSQESTPRHGLDVVVPANVIGLTMIAGLIATSIVACFAYYPSPKECLEEIRLARAECLSGANSGQAEHALFWLPVWEDWSRRIEVGTFLRHGEVRPYQRMQGYLIRKKLELLEHELEHDPFELKETQNVVRDLLKADARWVRSFREKD